jgi:LPXTG-motif cell wall-anchored protein
VQAIDSTSAGIVWYSFTDESRLSYATVALGASAASEPVIINPDPAMAYTRLPSLSVLGDIRLVTWWADGNDEDPTTYLVSASCDAGATWTTPLELAGGETVSAEDAVSIVSGAVFTTSWGMYSDDYTSALVYAASTDSPCAGITPAALPATGSTAAAQPMLLLGAVLLAVGALVVVRRRATH